MWFNDIYAPISEHRWTMTDMDLVYFVLVSIGDWNSRYIQYLRGFIKINRREGLQEGFQAW